MSFRQHFSCSRKNWLYEDAYSNSFTQLQWTKSLKISIIWRALFFTWWVVNFIRAYIIHFPIGHSKLFPLIYLTRWGELAILSYSLVSLLTVAAAVIKKRDYEEANCLEKFSGFLAELCATTSLCITILYYTLDTGSWKYDSLYIHFLNFIFMFLDLWMIRTNFKFYHFWVISLFFACYVVVNAIVWATDNTVVPYDALNWGTKTGFSVGVSIGVIFAASPIIHGIMCLVVCLRKWLAGKCGENDDEVVAPQGKDNFAMEL